MDESLMLFLIADPLEKMKVLLLTLILNIASVRFCNGEEEEEDRDELQQGFFEVDYMLQVQESSIWQIFLFFGSQGNQKQN